MCSEEVISLGIAGSDPGNTNQQDEIAKNNAANDDWTHEKFFEGVKVIYFCRMKIQFSTEWSFEEEVLVDDVSDAEEKHNLIVYNDDFNTFDHVIETLMRVCKHDLHQAEQCTYLIHFKGKCSVKKGSFEKLKPLREGITEAGIKAAIV